MPRHDVAQEVSFEHRCEVVHPSVDPRQVHFLDLIAKFCKVMRCSCDGAREVGGNRIGVEELGDSEGKCPGCAPMSGRVFGMPGVSTSGTQFGSGVVNGLPSVSASWIAV